MPYTLQPSVAKKRYISKNLYSNMADIKNLKCFPQAKHGSHYMCAKRDVIWSPGTAAIAKNWNFCILGIFCKFNPLFFELSLGVG